MCRVSETLHTFAPSGDAQWTLHEGSVLVNDGTWWNNMLSHLDCIKAPSGV